MFPAKIGYKVFFEWIIGAEVPITVKIGPRLRVYHLQSIVIHKDVVIGANFTLRHSTTIGNLGFGGQCPVIGDYVDVGAHVCILGQLRIGDNVRIGASTLVMNNVPSNSTVVGNPMAIKPHKEVK